MSFLTKLFNRDNPNTVMQPLYDAVIAEGRRLGWYESGDVPDTLDGRFDMITAILCLVMLRLEQFDEAKDETVWLTELFVRDMDGQLRQIGIGDMIVGKHVGRMMGAFGGRLGAYREAFDGKQDLESALVRNIYRGETPDQKALDFTSATLRNFRARLEQTELSAILRGQLPEAAST
ncbi:ubiquinol-cytochrome C chaperone family protein [Parasphingorhabdus sp.]|uniref:ubiquinol-cytochrome C chaperone family protein n=1 Tax=Parasphingorhabdus sp. TaxID=2709688 RepID=UPI003265C154